jgi:hypothetical protein
MDGIPQLNLLPPLDQAHEVPHSGVLQQQASYSIKLCIQHLPGAADFPTKVTWLEAICKGSYLSLPLINVNSISKYLAKFKDTQKEHICNYNARGQTQRRQGHLHTKQWTYKVLIALAPLGELPKTTIQQRQSKKRHVHCHL